MNRPSEAIATLAHLRRTQERAAHTVASIGESLFNPRTSVSSGAASELGKLSTEELCLIYEQVLLGALDTGKWALAHRMLSELQKQLPATSQRLVRLTGMMHEAKGEYAEAWNVYQRMLSADESSVYAMKRKIAVLRAAPVEHIVDDSNDDGKGSNIVSCGPAAAVRALTEYLDIHAIDHEAWMELADCYLALNMYRQALFCLDEVMLLIPQNHIPQLKAAETLYSIGHLASALKRFCRALELCPDNVRALYGIQLCLARLLNRSGDPSGSGDDAVAPPSQETLEKLSTLVSSQLNDIYTRSKGNKASASISVQGKRSYTAPSHLAAIVAQMCN